MPTYEYICKECGKKFEYFQHMNDPLLTICEDCGGSLERLVGAGSGLIFKGSGFYITDYAHAHTDVAASSASEHSGGSSAPVEKAKPAENSSVATTKASTESKSTSTESK